MFFCQLLCTRHTPFCFQFVPLGGLFLAAGPVLGSLVAFNMSSRLSGASPILTEMWLVIACAGGFFADVCIPKYKRCKQER